jgi:hypothetical protein
MPLGQNGAPDHRGGLALEPQSAPILTHYTPPAVDEVAVSHVSNAADIQRVAGWWLAVNADGDELACAPLDRLDDVLRTLGHDPSTVAIEQVPHTLVPHLGSVEFELC